MDDFGFDRPELNGALISLEFGSAGRIQQLWASDPNLPDEGEEFQFVLSPLSLGEEFSEDYLPGTILVGARTNPDEPWIVSRNAEAEILGGDEPSSIIEFEYELPFLEDIRATGKYYEIPGPVPVVAWDVRLANRGRKSIEIGELAFPFALNNLYEGLGKGDRSKSVWHDRVVVHKSIGGAASYLLAQRLTSEPPGLLIFPGDDTSWEFMSHVRSSLNSPFRWEGIPVVYVHSRASIEREGWPEWFNGHTSLILEPGDSRTYQTRFVATLRDKFDQAASTLAALKHPAIKLLTAAIAPADVGIAVEITGATPTRFRTDAEAHLEPDSDEDGGFCFVRPKKAGDVRLSFEDTLGRTSHAHLKFIEPIETLIKKRAKWIAKHQVHVEADSAFHGAIVATNTKTNQRLTNLEDLSGAFSVEGGLSDALFLAEKNTIYPDIKQIQVLDEFLDDFLRDDLQNPGDDTVGSAFADRKAVAVNYARPHIYPLVFNFYHAMYRVARVFGETRRDPQEYLKFAHGTAMAMARHGIPRQGRGVGFPGYARIWDILTDLANEGMNTEVERLMPFVSMRAEDLLKREYPFSTLDEIDSSVFEEAFTAARYLNDEHHQEQAMRCAYALRSLAPSWWWYGSDSRQWDETNHGDLPIGWDRGEMCLGYTGPENSMMFFETLDRDYSYLPEAYMRLAFGGMLGVWGLVQEDGAGSMGYCPDPASRLFGYVPLTGDLGVALFHYLRSAGSYVLPSANYGVFTFGCHFEVEEGHYVVRPWDGVGRKIVLRQVGAEFHLSIGKIREFTLDSRKRWALIRIENPSDKDLRAELRARGLWGRKFRISGKEFEAVDGELAITIPLAASSVSRIEIEVIE